MSYENVKEYFTRAGLGARVRVLERSSRTVALAAAAIGCEAKQIAKTLSFLVDDAPVIIVVAGDARIDNKKFKTAFGKKPKLAPAEQLESLVGHGPGGLCPFAIKPGIDVYLDISLKRNMIIYPAAGDGQSAVKLSIEELEQHAAPRKWVDLCQEIESAGLRGDTPRFFYWREIKTNFPPLIVATTWASRTRPGARLCRS